MSDTVWILGTAFGLSAGALSYGVLSGIFGEERRVRRRLESMSANEVRDAAAVEPLTRPMPERLMGSFVRGAGGVAAAITPTTYATKLRENLRLAGPRMRLSAEQFVLIKLAAALGGLALGFSAARTTDYSSLLDMALVVGGAVIGLMAPDAWLSGRIDARKHAIRRALPDMLDMLMISVEAGLGFDAALAKVISSTTGPLSEEFAVMLQEVQAGISRRDALTRLSGRTAVPELSAFTMAIVQADVFGVSVANVLRGQSKEMRVRRRQRAEEMAQQAPAQMVFPIILCILPATIIVVAGPAVISIMRLFGVGL